mgnify:CR=1 FL=1
METVNLSVVDWLLFEDTTINIANYQRPYVWSESHVTAFTENLLNTLLNREKGAPDIGVIIIERTPKGEYIADGQQRLLTFALFMEEFYGKGLRDARKIGVIKNSRFRSLLEFPTGNLQTVIHARQAQRTIRTLLSQRQDLAKLKNRKSFKESKKNWITFLKSVTFSLVEFTRNSGDPSNPAITQYFEPLNSTAKPLNGGQILKAYHMGRIFGETPADTWDIQSRYEGWFRQHKRNRNLRLSEFDPIIFNGNTNDFLSIERFIDSPGQDVRYKLGCGFVQAIQAITLGQDEWWFEIGQQGKQRQLPFERLEGREKARQGGWSASAPLEFGEAQGFFSMVNRIGQLYTAYCQELLKLPGCENWRIKTSLLARSTSISDQDRRPAILICDAARRLEDSFQILNDWSKRESRLQTEEALGSLCKNRERKQIAEGFLHAKSWLGLGNEGEDLHSTYGFIPTAIFASALAWTDRFPDYSANKEIVRVLMLQLLFANLHERSVSVLKVLFMKESVAATQFSGHVQGALWRFMRTARCKWDLMEWLQKFEYLLTRILDTVSSNELKQNVQQYELKVESLTTLRDSLSLYLSF